MNFLVRHLKRTIIWVTPILLVTGLAWLVWPQPREVVYSLYRERGKTKTLTGLEGYQRMESAHFEVLYTEADRDVVGLVLDTAESVFQPVVDFMGFAPSERVPIILYPNRAELRSAFGWGNGESAMGVYWSGTIRLLSPNVWISEQDEKVRNRVFRKLNPIAHELTHYLLDYMTNGNYPRWFTEGLAQRVEYQVTGFLWIEPESTLRQDLYSLDNLQNGFDQLRNQPLAYRQSYLLVDYMALTYGEEQLTALLDRLSSGMELGKAVRQTTGLSMGQVHADWLHWMQQNLDMLDPVR